MLITGMRVYKFFVIVSTLILGPLLIIEILTQSDKSLIVTYSLAISANLILYPIISRNITKQ